MGTAGRSALEMGMQTVEAALRAHLRHGPGCDRTQELVLAWIAGHASPTSRRIGAFKMCVRSAGHSVVALLTREQLEGCADGVVHPDVIGLVRECIVALRGR